MAKRQGSTVFFDRPVIIRGGAAVGGKEEGKGPLADCFDCISRDSYFGEKSWEDAESTMLRRSLRSACRKSGIKSSELDFILSGDLLNQCTASAFAADDSGVPFLGLYGACSTMGEALALGSMLIDGGAAGQLCAMTSSHFCTAERQFRLPLEYGGQRSPSAQRTATAAGAVILAKDGQGPCITHATAGRIVDAGITDAANMGAAMAPAALDTILKHLGDTKRAATYYDAVITGDLGYFGHTLLSQLLETEGIEMPVVSTDCGMLLYNASTQDVHCGGSGCGCSASVFAGHIIKRLRQGMWKRVLFAPTGALMSPVSSMQGRSIPGICHAVAIEGGN